MGRIESAIPASARIMDKIIRMSTGTNWGLAEPANACNPIKLKLIFRNEFPILIYASNGPNAAQSEIAPNTSLIIIIIIGFPVIVSNEKPLFGATGC